MRCCAPSRRGPAVLASRVGFPGQNYGHDGIIESSTTQGLHRPEDTWDYKMSENLEL